MYISYERSYVTNNVQDMVEGKSGGVLIFCTFF